MKECICIRYSLQKFVKEELVCREKESHKSHVNHISCSLSIRRFWGKGEKWKRKRKRGEGKKLPFSSPPPPSPI